MKSLSSLVCFVITERMHFVFCRRSPIGVGVQLNPPLVFPDLRCREEAAKNTKTLIIPRGGKYKFNGNFSFVALPLVYWCGQAGWIDRRHTCHLFGLYHPFTVPLHSSSLCLIKKGGTVAFVWLTCLTKVTAAHGCMWMSGPAPLLLCTSVRAGAGRVGWKETNWTQKEGHSPSPDPPQSLHPSIPFRFSAGPSSACWLIPFSLPL